jgi:hypothetical protein
LLDLPGLAIGALWQQQTVTGNGASLRICFHRGCLCPTKINSPQSKQKIPPTNRQANDDGNSGRQPGNSGPMRAVGDETTDHRGREWHSRIFRPRIIADRIQAQSGIFTVHAAIGTASNKRLIPLETNSKFSSKLVKLPIPAVKFQSLREQLHVCGVNHSTMFPDLDGLCRHLTWRYTKPYASARSL